jgi:hypothetical protein
MSLNNNSWLQLTCAVLTSFSLVAAAPNPNAPFPYIAAAEAPAQAQPAEELLIQSDDAMAPADEEDETNVDDDLQPADPKLQKVLYDPKMNYGTGAPAPKPTPTSTATRNLIAFGTSVVLGTIAMLVVAHNPGKDAQPYRSK